MDAVSKRCLGWTLRSRRCGRYGATHFCADHRRQPVFAVITALVALALAFVPDLLLSRDAEILRSQKEIKQDVVAATDRVSGVERDVSEIRRLLEHQSAAKPEALEKGLGLAELQTEYDLGFAIVFSDGRRTLHYGRPIDAVGFDPASVRVVQLRADRVCVDPGTLRLGIATITGFSGLCMPRVVGAEHNWFVDPDANIAVRSEVIADGAEGVAMVFGYATKSVPRRPPKE